MSWFLIALKKYAVFSGRARRREYWYYVLFTGIVGAILYFLALGPVYAGMGTMSTPGAVLPQPNPFWLSLFGLFELALLLPSLAVTVRRLHDTGRSGWWILLSVVPIANIVLLVFYCLDSQPGENKWGPNPKGVYAGPAEPATLI